MVLSFEEIEDVLGFSLPASASKHSAWWANGGHTQASAWLDAGWLVESPTGAVHTHTVTFIKETTEKKYEKTYHKNPHNEQNEQTNSKKLHNTPQEIFAYFNCTFPPQDKHQLRESYLRMIKENHPDKVAGMAKSFVELAERKTKEINDMYEKASAYFKR